ELFKGQKIVLEAYAKLGIGKTHVKWQPVSTASFKYKAILNIDQEKCKNCDSKQCVEICPKQILSTNESGEVVIKDILKCSLCKECENACENGAIKVGWDENTFIFYLESVGQLSPDRIMTEACKIFKKKVTDFLEALDSS
ncbi:MAG: DNA-directed RNA polymerase subunit D, partial [Candidatus Helarchaeales archaeon]